MPVFSVLVRVQDATPAILSGLVATLTAQTFVDWELILLPDKDNLYDRDLVLAQVQAHAQVRGVLRDSTEIAPWVANRIIDSLGGWVAVMDQRDRLDPTALAKIYDTFQANLSAQIIYTDEESHNRDGVVSLRFTKGDINPVRLRYYDYLRNLAFVARETLRAMGGYHRMASDFPSHDLYLRILDAYGPQVFINIPERLFFRHRNHAERGVGKERLELLNGFDMWGIQEHLDRNGIAGVLRRRGGTAEIVYKPHRKPWVTLIVINDGTPLLEETMRTAYTHFLYRPLTVKAITNGPDLVQELNQEISRCDTEYACVLWGLPANTDWLDDLIGLATTPGAGAIGGRLINPIQMVQPGLAGYRFEGWDWNSRGRFNELTTPHNVSAVSQHCLLLDVAKFVEVGQFDPSLPQLFSMDYCLRLAQAGYSTIQVPRCIVQVNSHVPTSDEILEFWSRYPGWVCPYGLHFTP